MQRRCSKQIRKRIIPFDDPSHHSNAKNRTEEKFVSPIKFTDVAKTEQALGKKSYTISAGKIDAGL